MSGVGAEGGNTLTVRLIRSFPHRNVKYIVLHDVDFSLTTEQFMQLIIEDVQKRAGIPPPFKKYTYDTLKIQHKAHGSKTSNPIIVLEDDEKLILKAGLSLAECGIGNETEISFFKMSDYQEYKANPQTTW